MTVTYIFSIPAGKCVRYKETLHYVIYFTRETDRDVNM